MLSCCWYFYNSIKNYPTDLWPAVHNYKTQNRNYSDLTKNYWQTLSSSWTKMLALNFLISVREWGEVMRAFLISADDQLDDSPGDRTVWLVPDWRRQFLQFSRRVVWHKFVWRVQTLTAWAELFSVLSALSSSIDCGIAGWQKPTKTNRILV